MPKAYLTNLNYEVDASYDTIMNVHGEVVSQIKGPRRYIYHMTFVSDAPLDISKFQSLSDGIDEQSEHDMSKFYTKETISALTEKKVEKKAEKVVVTNPIHSLEV